jgi:hypothetical protein
VRDLTAGFDKNYGFTNLVMLGERWNTMPWLAWSPEGDRLAYLVRTGKERTLIVPERADAKIEDGGSDEVDRRAGVAVVLRRTDARSLAALRGGIGASFHGQPDTQEIENGHDRRFLRLTPDATRLTAPTSSTNARVSENQSCSAWTWRPRRRRRSPSAPTTRRRRSSSTTTRAVLVDGDRPDQPLDPEVAKNGNIYNAWTLDLKTASSKQYTDTLGGILSPIVLNDGRSKIAFVSYYKGDYGIHTIERKEPLVTAASRDFGAPGPIIDFQAPLQHTLVPRTSAQEGVREDVPRGAAAGETSASPTTATCSAAPRSASATCSGDKQVNVFARRSRSTGRCRSATSTGQALPVRAAGYSQTQFFYGQLEGVFYDPSLAPYVSRDLAQATRTVAAAAPSASTR